jgi:hypothetical protein
MQLSPKVSAAIDRFFPEAERPVVAHLLAEYGDAPHEREAERIHLLILKMSRTEVDRVRNLVAAAKRDYRDVIAWSVQPPRTYIVGLLRNGPNAGNKDALTPSLLRKWKREGAIVIGGLCLGEGGLRGFYIFTVDSIEAAQELVNDDSAIQSGRLEFEFHKWIAADGLQVGVPKHYLDIDIH